MSEPQQIRDRLRGLEASLNSEIIGQEEAIRVFSQAVVRAEYGLSSKADKPKGSFLFLGPTGVGKTELTLALSRHLYGSEAGIHRFDMAEYQVQDSLKLLLGDSRSEQGLLGVAVDKLNDRGGGVMLFDEIEKAHPALITIFLGILDAGRATMSSGEVKSFSNVYMVFTSNLGTADAMNMTSLPYTTLRRHVLGVAQQHFRPEVFARFKEKIVFRSLSYNVQVEICRRRVELECAQIKSAIGVEILFDGMVLNYLIRKGYDRKLGARPLRDTVEREIGNAVVDYLHQEERLPPEARLIVDGNDLRIVVPESASA